MEVVFAAILWVVANAVYAEMRREGRRGLRRLVAFWIGWPGTLVGLVSIDEGSQPPLRDDDHGLPDLVERIRADRADRIGGGSVESSPADRA